MAYDDLDAARSIIGESARVVVLTGAGVSAESGVPTFRGSGGLWKARSPTSLATPEAFANDPKLVWEWYCERRRNLAGCSPNPAHHALADFVAASPRRAIVTQNVDGLHRRAAEKLTVGGDEPKTANRPAWPIELHGAIDRDRCTGCGQRTRGSLEVDVTSISTLPHCKECDCLLRPDVVWFGESLDEDVLLHSFELAGRADLCLVVGTSAEVYPAAAIPLATRDRGARILEVNPEATPLSAAAALSLRGPAAVVLPELLGG